MDGGTRSGHRDTGRAATAGGARPGAALPRPPEGLLAAALASEAARYLAAVDGFRREGCRITWAPEQPGATGWPAPRPAS